MSVLRAVGYVILACIVLGFAEMIWQFDRVGFANWPGVKSLETVNGWKSVRGDHPKVSKSPLGLLYVVHTDRAVYIANLSVDDDVADHLNRLAVE